MRDNPLVRKTLLIALAHQGRLDEARSELQAVKAFLPEGHSLEVEKQRLLDIEASEETTALHLEGYRLAGLE